MKVKPLNSLCEAWSGFSEDYVVADDGCIYRLKDEDYRPLKSGWYRSGHKYPYQQVRGYFGTEKQHTIKVHRAVAMAFCERPAGATDVDHINNVKTDNRAVNLQWLSHKDNIAKMRRDKHLTLMATGKETA